MAWKFPRPAVVLSRLAISTALLATACGEGGPTTGEGPEGEQTMEVRGAAGLYTSPSQAMGAPVGAMQQADNVRIRRPGVAETKRGDESVPALAAQTPVLAMTSWRGALITLHEGGVLARTVAGVRTVYAGTYLPPSGASMRFLETAGNLLFTTSKGVYRLDSVTGPPKATGVTKALLGKARSAARSGFLPSKRAVAYRDVFSTRDDNDRLFFGAPSDRVTFYNGVRSATSATRAGSTVTVTFPSAHGFLVADSVDIAFNANDSTLFTSGIYTVATVPNATTLTFTSAGTAGSTTVAPTVGLASVNVTRSVVIPQGITTNHILQTYRSGVTGSETELPDDELALVQEVYPTPAEVAAGLYEFTDIAPEAFGANLYTNPQTGDESGILGGNDVPPVARVLGDFEGYAFYGDVSGVQRLYLTMLRVPAEGERISFTAPDGGFYQLQASSITDVGTTYLISSTGSVAEDIALTAQSLVRSINRNTSFVYAYYVGGATDSPGAIVVERRDVYGAEFSFQVTGGATHWAPATKIFFDASLSRAANVVTATTAFAHELRVGQEVLNSNPGASFGAGPFTITSTPTPTTFTYGESGPNTGTTAPMETADPAVSSDAEEGGNVFAWGAYQNPDGVPPGNYGRLDDASATIKWTVKLGGSMLVGTTRGLYRVTGTKPSDFQVKPLSGGGTNQDSNFRATGNNMVAVLGDVGFADTTRGIQAFTEYGVKEVPATLRIEEELRALRTSLGDVYGTKGFMLAYPDENELYLWVPTSASDVGATQAYVYNSITDTWVHDTSIFGARTAAVGPGVIAGGASRGMHLFRAGLTGGVFQERNTGTGADYVLSDGSPVPIAVTYLPTDFGTGESPKVWSNTWFFTQGTQPASASVTYTNELNATPTTFPLVTNPVPSVPLGSLWNAVDRDHGRSMTLSVGFSASVPTRTELLGYGQQARVTMGKAATR